MGRTDYRIDRKPDQLGEDKLIVIGRTKNRPESIEVRVHVRTDYSTRHSREQYMVFHTQSRGTPDKNKVDATTLASSRPYCSACRVISRAAPPCVLPTRARSTDVFPCGIQSCIQQRKYGHTISRCSHVAAQHVHKCLGRQAPRSSSLRAAP